MINTKRGEKGASMGGVVARTLSGVQILGDMKLTAGGACVPLASPPVSLQGTPRVRDEFTTSPQFTSVAQKGGNRTKGLMRRGTKSERGGRPP